MLFSFVSVFWGVEHYMHLVEEFKQMGIGKRFLLSHLSKRIDQQLTKVA